MIDYSGFRLSEITQPRFRHVLLLAYWPVYGLVFLFLERMIRLPYHVMHCALDDAIPFCEWFVIPYYFWFVFLIGMLIYTFFEEPSCFARLMCFLIVANTVVCLIFVIYPTCQELRPRAFARDNAAIRVVRMLYQFDTDTNVCPSLHVVDSIAVVIAAFHTRRFRAVWKRALFVIAAVLICLSTLFLKQHSVWDLVWAIPVCAAAYPVSSGLYYFLFGRSEPIWQKK